VRDLGRQLPLEAVWNELSCHKAAEGALINKPEFASIIIESDAHTKVLLVGSMVRLHQELTAHAEVCNECRAVIEWQPQVFASSTHASHGASDECGFKRTLLPAHGTLVQYLNSANGSRTHVLREPATHDLDLGKLGHQ
jgi:hypothetical protein